MNKYILKFEVSVQNLVFSEDLKSVHDLSEEKNSFFLRKPLDTFFL